MYVQIRLCSVVKQLAKAIFGSLAIVWGETQLFAIARLFICSSMICTHIQCVFVSANKSNNDNGRLFTFRTTLQCNGFCLLFIQYTLLQKNHISLTF